MPFPWTNSFMIHYESSDELFYDFKVNYLLIIFSLLKLAYLINAFLFHSKYMRPRSNRICTMYGEKANFLFTLKAIFIDYPFSFIISISIISIMVFTFAFRISEHETYSSSDPSTVYMNMFWMTVITITSVGFGDYSATTPISRIIAGLCVIWGGFILSVLVVVNINAFALNRRIQCDI